jgi:hypothetical protein
MVMSARVTGEKKANKMSANKKKTGEHSKKKYR